MAITIIALRQRYLLAKYAVCLLVNPCGSRLVVKSFLRLGCYLGNSNFVHA